MEVISLRHQYLSNLCWEGSRKDSEDSNLDLIHLPYLSPQNFLLFMQKYSIRILRNAVHMIDGLLSHESDL